MQATPSSLHSRADSSAQASKEAAYQGQRRRRGRCAGPVLPLQRAPAWLHTRGWRADEASAAAKRGDGRTRRWSCPREPARTAAAPSADSGRGSPDAATRALPSQSCSTRRHAGDSETEQGGAACAACESACERGDRTGGEAERQQQRPPSTEPLRCGEEAAPPPPHQDNDAVSRADAGSGQRQRLMARRGTELRRGLRGPRPVQRVTSSRSSAPSSISRSSNESARASIRPASTSAEVPRPPVSRASAARYCTLSSPTVDVGATSTNTPCADGSSRSIRTANTPAPSPASVGQVSDRSLPGSSRSSGERRAARARRLFADECAMQIAPLRGEQIGRFEANLMHRRRILLFFFLFTKRILNTIMAQHRAGDSDALALT